MKVLKLGDICSFSRGLTYKKSDEVAFSKNIVLRANNIDLNTNSLLLDDLRYIKDSIKIDTEKLVRKNSLIICTASGSKSHLGKVALITEEFGYSFGGFMGQITPSKDCHHRYLFYILTSPNFKDFLMGLTDGTNINNLKFKDIQDYKVQLPKYEDQIKIVEHLNQAFTEINSLEKNLELKEEKANQLLQSMFNAALNNDKYDKKSVTLDEICENLDSQRIPITREVRTVGKYPYYGASGIIDYVEDFIFEGNALLVSEDGANLLARSTPIAFSVTGKYWVNNHAHVLRFTDQYLQEYVKYFLENTNLDKYVTGAAQPKLTQRALNNIPIEIPLNKLDIKLASEALSNLKELTFLLAENIIRRRKLANELKSAFLNKYLVQQVA